MKRKNSSDLAFEASQIMLSFVSPERVNERTIYECSLEEEHNDHIQYQIKKELDEYDEAIEDCKGMLEYSLDTFKNNPSDSNREEVIFWRKQLQQTKTAKRIFAKKYINILKTMEAIA